MGYLAMIRKEILDETHRNGHTRRHFSMRRNRFIVFSVGIYSSLPLAFGISFPALSEIYFNYTMCAKKIVVLGRAATILCMHDLHVGRILYHLL